MRKTLKIFLPASIVLAAIWLAAADPVAMNLDEEVTQADDSSEYVMGRPIESSYEYQIEAYEPIDTAISIDESGSMSGQMGNAKSAARDYVDNTRTGDGDQNAIISFDGSGHLRQPLTGSKSQAKSEINSISSGGGTDLPAGVSTAHSALNSGSNPVQVMIVLGDGAGGNPGSQADAARSDGIDVHGIMYGSGADSSEFESLTDSQCSSSSSENTDGDNCWYAETGTVDAVYEAIQEEVSTETDLELRMRLDDMAYSADSYSENNDLVGGTQEFVRQFNDVDDGSYEQTFQWRPTDHGSNVDLRTGDSELELDAEGSVSAYTFSGTETHDIGYVDFRVLDFEASRSQSGIDLEVEIENNGDTESKERELAVEQSSGNQAYSTTLPSLGAGESTTLNFQIPDGHTVLSPVQVLDILADPSGFWDSTSHGHGEVLEPDETDNIVELGYPPKINDVTFENRTDAHAFEVEADIDMLTDGNNFGECQIELTDEQDNEYPVVGTLYGDLEATSGTSARCTYETVNSSVPEFDVYEEIDVNVSVEDEEGSTTWMERSNTIPNRPPLVTLQSPADNALELERDAQLSVFIDDPEDDEIETVEFIDDVTGETIEAVPGPNQGTYSVEWEDLNLGNYEWRVVASDPYESRESGVRSFQRVISEIYRVENEVQHDYSSLIVEEDGTRFVFVETSINTDSREFTTYLEGENIEASFVENDQSSKTYELEPGNPERHQIRINGTQQGEGELRIATGDGSVNVNTTETFPVYIRESVEEGQPVPGLTGFYMLIILLSSATLYFASL